MSTTNTSSVMIAIEDDSAPLLPHEISTTTTVVAPPLPTTPSPHRPKQLLLTVTATYGQKPAIVSPAVPVLPHRPPSPLEPFPAFDPSVGPPEESPYYHSFPVYSSHGGNNHGDNGVKDAATAHTPAAEPQQHQYRECEQDKHHTDFHVDRTPPNPITASATSATAALLSSHEGEVDNRFLSLMIRCHTLFALAERLLPPTSTAANKKALAYVTEARRVLAGLEKQSRTALGKCDCLPQQQRQQQQQQRHRLIEVSAGNLREKLKGLEEKGLTVTEEKKEGEEAERTARVTAWLEML